MTRSGLFLVLALGLSGCAQGRTGIDLTAFFNRLFTKAPPPPAATPHYVLGPGYPAGGIWYYPAESFGLDQTGIATIQSGPHDRLTTDGEIFDAGAMAGAHQTLQLPAVVRVTNLGNGREALIRLNDRGPDSPARILAVTPRVAELLGFDPDGTARVRMQVESGPSQAVAAELHGGGIAITAAPIGAVQADALAPPPGARVSSRAVATASSPRAAAAVDDIAAVPAKLAEAVQQGEPNPGSLWIEAGRFGRESYANRRAAQLAAVGARAERVSSGGQTSYNVRIGPYGSVGAADAALAQVIGAGVTDARIEVE